jgi:DNA-binding NtrC family response regulator
MMILIVDDDASHRRDLAADLRDEHYEILECSNGNQALNLDSNSLKNISLAIIDYKMPGINGLKLGFKLREKAPHIELVMLTAYANQIPTRKLVEDSALWKSFHQKPYNKQRLLEVYVVKTFRTLSALS